MIRSKIAGMGFYVPANVVSNNDLSKRVNTTDEWIKERTGTSERHFFVPEEDTNFGMGVKAATVALDKAGLTPQVAVCEALEQGKIKKGDLVCLASFGSGFTWASALIGLILIQCVKCHLL
jgi:3-oxoacyl-[acyl-carrier-protein] synthase III